MPASKKKKKAIIDYGPFSDLRNYDLSKAVLSGNEKTWLAEQAMRAGSTMAKVALRIDLG